MEAHAAGSAHYFTGLPCKHGHTAPRGTQDCRCTACRSMRSGQGLQSTQLRDRFTPPWQTPDEREAIKRFYRNRPAGMTVDHIVPLRHILLQGLHVLANLQYLTREENARKGTALPDGLTLAQAIKRGMAISRVDAEWYDEVNWKPYWPAHR